MKLKTLVIAVAAIAATSSALAQQTLPDGGRFAPVTRVEPIYQTYIQPHSRQECQPTQVPVYRNVAVRSYTPASEGSSGLGTVLGAVVGIALAGDASVGAQVGAAIVGGAVGNAIGSAPNSHVVGYENQLVGYQWQQRCEVVTTYHERSQVIGYTVTYVDRGVAKSVTMAKPPGTHVRIVPVVE